MYGLLIMVLFSNARTAATIPYQMEPRWSLWKKGRMHHPVSIAGLIESSMSFPAPPRCVVELSYCVFPDL
uniref:Secreted protein n=1 Tax=Picea glauca TaxID=3330 RepID=A0A117NJ45_PICGL|nr:hypothetical protein ABT39_MTgene821 [Picea glauca]QHR87164.1 hypothetical protein Q903MT_gene1173 [Picea sitchensis]